MYVTVKWDIPISDFDVIKAGTQLEVIESWNEYKGFIAVRYRGGSIYFNELYFTNVPALVECV